MRESKGEPRVKAFLSTLAEGEPRMGIAIPDGGGKGVRSWKLSIKGVASWLEPFNSFYSSCSVWPRRALVPRLFFRLAALPHPTSRPK